VARRDRKRRRSTNPGPAPTEPHRDNVPGSLEHASGDVEEFEAGIVAGAGGDPVEESDASDAELAAAAEEAARAAGATGLAPGSGRPSPHEPVKGFRVFNFFRACWAELQRVQWPDRRAVGQATAVVLGFVVIAGAYLGLADVVAQRVIDFIL
jgi:preprotein translocase SecE subunit